MCVVQVMLPFLVLLRNFNTPLLSYDSAVMIVKKICLATMTASVGTILC